jgi:hypothetical protein
MQVSVTRIMIVIGVVFFTANVFAQKYVDCHSTLLSLRKVKGIPRHRQILWALRRSSVR